jgi:hypothetical protein
MKSFAPILIAVGMLICTCSCSKSDPVVGTWKGTPTAGSGMTDIPEAKLTLGADQAFTVSMGATTYTGTWQPTDDGIKAEATKRNGVSVAGRDGMVLDLKLSSDGTMLKSPENPIEWRR